MAGALDAPLARALAEVAREGGAISDAAALRAALGPRLDRAVGRMTVVIAGDTVRLRDWPEPVVAVDLGVRGRLAGRHTGVIGCGDPEDAAGLLRTACLLTTAARDGIATDAYLVAAGAERALDGAGPAGRLLAAGERAMAPLLREAGVDHLVAGEGVVRVPARVATEPVAAVPLEGGRALRAVRLRPGGGDLALESRPSE
jgi:hypothetical protein